MWPKRYRWMQFAIGASVLAYSILAGLIQAHILGAPGGWGLATSLLVLLPGFAHVGDGPDYALALVHIALATLVGLTGLGTVEAVQLPWLLATLGAVLLARALRPPLEWLHTWCGARHRNLHIDVRIEDTHGNAFRGAVLLAEYPDGRRIIRSRHDSELPRANGRLTLHLYERATPACAPIALEALAAQDIVVIEREAPGVFALRVIYNHRRYLAVSIADQRKTGVPEALVVACYTDGRRYRRLTGRPGRILFFPLPAGEERVALYAAVPEQLDSAASLDQLADRLVGGTAITTVAAPTADGASSSICIKLAYQDDGRFVAEER